MRSDTATKTQLAKHIDEVIRAIESVKAFLEELSEEIRPARKKGLGAVPTLGILPGPSREDQKASGGNLAAPVSEDIIRRIHEICLFPCPLSMALLHRVDQAIRGPAK